MAAPQHPVTPDGRYFVVRGKLWRMANPNLAPAKKAALVNELMKARSAVRLAKLAGRPIEEAAVHHAVVREMVFRLEDQPASRRIFMRIARRKTEIFA